MSKAVVLKPHRRWKKIALRILGVLMIGFVWVAWPGCNTFTVSKETTFITEPLDDKGFVNYGHALNERLRGTITPEQNANVLLIKALGPRPEDRPLTPAFYQWLGIDPLPEEGDYIVSWTSYMKTKFPQQSREDHERSFDQFLASCRAPWAAKDNPALADWLKLNDKPLTLVIEATRRPEYFNPLISEIRDISLSGVRFSNVQAARGLAAALTSRAMLKVQERKTTEAWQDLLACHRLGRLVGRGGCVIEALVGIAVDDFAFKADRALLEHGKLTSQQANECLEELQKLPPLPLFAEKITLTQRVIALDALQHVVRYGPDAILALVDAPTPQLKEEGFFDRCFKRSINYDAGFRYINQMHTRTEEVLRINAFQDRKKAIASFRSEIDGAKRDAGTFSLGQHFWMDSSERGRRIGQIVIGLFLTADMNAQTAAERAEQTQRNAHIAFAIAAYRHDKGQYPAQLSELMPKYLKTVPDDLFNEQPLFYERVDDGYLLYSVGPNGLDEEGRTKDFQPPGDDITIMMPSLFRPKKP